MGKTATAQCVLLGVGGSVGRALSLGAHHRCLGSGRSLPYSAAGGKKSVTHQTSDRACHAIILQQAHSQPSSQLAEPSSGGNSGVFPSGRGRSVVKPGKG